MRFGSQNTDAATFVEETERLFRDWTVHLAGEPGERQDTGHSEGPPKKYWESEILEVILSGFQEVPANDLPLQLPPKHNARSLLQASQEVLLREAPAGL